MSVSQTPSNQTAIDRRSKARRLLKPGEYFYRGDHPWRSMSSFRRQLWRRHVNGLVACGAVVESPLGLLIDPPPMARWIAGDFPREEVAA